MYVLQKGDTIPKDTHILYKAWETNSVFILPIDADCRGETWNPAEHTKMWLMFEADKEKI